MKPFFLPPLLAGASLLVCSCDPRPDFTLSAASAQASSPAEPSAAVTPETGTAPDPEEDAGALQHQIDELKAQETELRLRLQQEELDAEKADLERQRAELALERETLRNTPASSTARTVPPPAPETPPAADYSVTSEEAGDYQMFYEGLSPYGEWFDTAEYGYVWQPSSRPQGWRPYTMGRWADSDQGWTWISDEPFGWATYHYGRWALLERRGWIWVPGDTWAPSWVAWRTNNDCIGWSPLPPETLYAENSGFDPGVEETYAITPESYIFIPVQYFDEPVHTHCRPVTENIQFFSLTTGVTRIIFRSGSVHCGGPPVNWVNTRLDHPMRHYRIHRDRAWDRYDVRARFENDRLNCYAPTVRAVWNDGLRPPRVHGRLENVKVIRRQEIFRGDLQRRFLEERSGRREKADAALRNETVRRQADRRGQLEKIRAQRWKLAERGARLPGADRRGSDSSARPGQEGPDRRNTANNGSEDTRRRPDNQRPGFPRSGNDRPVRGEDARQHQERQARIEAARRELKERQEEVARLRGQAGRQTPARPDQTSGGARGPGRADDRQRGEEAENRRREAADQARRGRQAQEENSRRQQEQQARRQAENRQRQEAGKRQSEARSQAPGSQQSRGEKPRQHRPEEGRQGGRGRGRD